MLVTGCWILDAAEPKGIEGTDRARAHCKNVADDPSNTRRRPLKRLDRTWVIVGFDLERDGQTVAAAIGRRLRAGAQ